MNILEHYETIINGVMSIIFVIQIESKIIKLNSNTIKKERIRAYHSKSEKWQIAIKYVPLGLVKFFDKSLHNINDLKIEEGYLRGYGGIKS